jgi:hypothetical protein
MSKKRNPYVGAEYDHEYDAYYNPKTGEWIEETCGASDCDFCRNRPDKHYDKNTKKSGRPQGEAKEGRDKDTKKSRRAPSKVGKDMAGDTKSTRKLPTQKRRKKI